MFRLKAVSFCLRVLFVTKKNEESFIRNGQSGRSFFFKKQKAQIILF